MQSVGMVNVPTLYWDAEAASEAYIDTVRAVAGAAEEEPNVAELLAAMAAGSGARLIVETWACGGGAATSTGLAIARRHTGGRHVCVVPDARAGTEYAAALAGMGVAEGDVEVVVGEIEAGVEAADFLVMDCRVKGWEKVVRRVKVGKKGVVVVCRGAGPGGVPWRGVVGSDARVVRAAYMPVGAGVDIAQLAAGGEGRRWIKHVDRFSGEEHIFRR